MEGSEEKLLTVEDLKIQFQTRGSKTYAVNGVSFNLKKSEILCVVGESGCGKSVTMMSIARLIPSPPGKVTGGKITFDGKRLLELSKNEMRSIRGSDIGIVFQDPMVSFNPVYTIGNQLMEALLTHRKLSKSEAKEKVCNMLRLVGISNPEQRMKLYPHQFSGGMLQRVMIAMALICNPKLLIADEPTTALDVTIEAQIVDLVKELQKEFGMAIIWITHDLGLTASMADRVAVMYGGFIVETAPVSSLYSNPTHPYTKGLLNSLPKLDVQRQNKLQTIGGMPPVFKEPPKGCPFADRCSYVMDCCYTHNPPLININDDHSVACWLTDESITNVAAAKEG